MVAWRFRGSCEPQDARPDRHDSRCPECNVCAECTALRLVDQLGFTDPTAGHDVAPLHLATQFDLSVPNAKAITLVMAADEAAGAMNPGMTSTVTGWNTPGNLQTLLESFDDCTQRYFC